MTEIDHDGFQFSSFCKNLTRENVICGVILYLRL